MSAPVNDNWANAIALNINGTSQFGTNVDATFETGEPNSLGKATVWYTYTRGGLAPPAQNTGADMYFQSILPARMDLEHACRRSLVRLVVRR
jgi:hypothetical protein